MRTLLAMLSLALAVAGCSAPRMRTASGRPEVTIKGQTMEQLKAHFVNDLTARGYTLRNDSPKAMVFEKRETGAISLLFRSELDAKAWNRVKLKLIDRGKGAHRAICTAFLVGNKDSPFEQEKEVVSEWEDIQAWLERTKASLESSPNK